MEKTLGLVLVGWSRTQMTVPVHKISLIGKPIVAHSVNRLTRICDAVHVEEATDCTVSDGALIERALARLKPEYHGEWDSHVYLVVHDAFQPLIQTELLQRLRKAIQANQLPIATTPVLHGQLEPTAVGLRTPVEPPIVVRLNDLERLFAEKEAQSLTLLGICLALAQKDDSELALISRTYAGGRLFSNLSLNEAEALLKVDAHLGLATSFQPPAGPKRVLVLGGSGGIGRACLALLDERAVSYIAPSSSELDLRIESSFPLLDEVDAVIHTAGVCATSAQEIMEVNFQSCVRLLEAVRTHEWCGSIVFLSSTAATFGRRGDPVYAASKAALNSLIESEAEAHYANGVRITAVAPAKVATNLQYKLNPDVPPGEMISPAYVAKAVLKSLQSAPPGSIDYIRKGEDL